MKLLQVVLFILCSVRTFSQDTISHRSSLCVSFNSVGLSPYKNHGALFTDGLVDYNHGEETNKSFSIGLTINRMLKANFGVRVKAFLTKRNLVSSYGPEYIDSSNINFPAWKASTSFKQNEWGLAPGFFYQLYIKKMALFCGLDFEYISHGKTYIQDTTSSLNGYDYYRELPKGFSAGVGSFMGFNFFPIKQLSIGGEVSFAMLHTHFAGLYHNKRIISSTSAVDLEVFIKDRFTSTQLTNPRCSLSISYWF